VRRIVAVLVLSACGGGSDYGSAPSASGSQISWDFTLGQAPECLSRRVPVDDGVGVCRLLVELEDDRACPEAAGWVDPLSGSERRPRVRETESGPRRSCEVQQLEGTALDACRTSEDCSGCEPGWCVTEVPSLLAACPGSHPFPFRFAAGAGEALPGLATATCVTVAD